MSGTFLGITVAAGISLLNFRPERRRNLDDCTIRIAERVSVAFVGTVTVPWNYTTGTWFSSRR
jgi:hypothetical protein